MTYLSYVHPLAKNMLAMQVAKESASIWARFYGEIGL